MRIDLHAHSAASDGTDPPADVVARARAAGVDVLALTDHDTLAGLDEARAALPPGLTLISGMELSSRLDGHSVHLLSYLPSGMSAELAAETQAIRDDRVRRGQAMVARLRELGVDVSWDQVAALAAGGSVGRPHIARAMVAAGAIGEPREAFSPDWIGTGGRAYVSRYALPPDRAIGLVRDSGGAVVLAHPGRCPGAGGSRTRPSPSWPRPGWPAWKWTTRITTRPSGPGCAGWPPALAC